MLGEKSRPDGVESRDTFSATVYRIYSGSRYLCCNRIWEIRHHGPVMAMEWFTSPEMGMVLAIGAISFTVFIIGHIMASMRLTKLELN